ncbi:hypothetical protein [Bifidobacterium erythrocebi]|uniref:hypothetical protein n=1 Tax=Bifidobacterium erythrocebi TaxID=2675325 RepID=UPI00145EA0B6|nr:hypothetical protein [Bifidobacterium sp. DSM 109960]
MLADYGDVSTLRLRECLELQALRAARHSGAMVRFAWAREEYTIAYRIRIVARTVRASACSAVIGGIRKRYEYGTA